MAEAQSTSALTADDHGAMLGTWNTLVRRARIGREKKLVALVVSSYANPDGTSIRCGVARLATDCEIGYSTARRYLAWLRQVGLIELVRAGNHKAGRADEYRLTISAHTQEQLEAPDAESYSALIEKLNDSNRKAQKGRRLGYQRSPKASADATDPALPISAHPCPSADRAISAHPEEALIGLSALTQGEPPPSTKDHLPRTADLPAGGAPPPGPRRPLSPAAPGNDEETSLSEPLTPAQDQEGELRPHAPASADPPPTDAPPTNPARQCDRGHRGMPAGRRGDGQPLCPFCRAHDRGSHLAPAS